MKCDQHCGSCLRSLLRRGTPAWCRGAGLDEPQVGLVLPLRENASDGRGKCGSAAAPWPLKDRPFAASIRICDVDRETAPVRRVAVKSDGIPLRRPDRAPVAGLARESDLSKLCLV